MDQILMHMCIVWPIQYIFKNIYLFTWLHQVLVVAHGIFTATHGSFLAACGLLVVAWGNLVP